MSFYYSISYGDKSQEMSFLFYTEKIGSILKCHLLIFTCVFGTSRVIMSLLVVTAKSTIWNGQNMEIRTCVCI